MEFISDYLLTPDKEKIAYYHYKSGHKNAVVIAHGFYDSKDSAVLQKLKERLIKKYDVFMLDFRGHGKSTGIFTWTTKESLDLIAVLTYVNKYYPRVGLIGFSLGGSISINVLSEYTLADSLVCVAAPLDIKKLDFKIWELEKDNEIIYSLFTKEGREGKGVRPGPFWLKKIKPVKSVKSIRVPVMYIHGGKDWLVKPWQSEVLYKKTKTFKKLIMIPDAPHAEYILLKYEDQFVSSVEDWFKQTVDNKKEVVEIQTGWNKAKASIQKFFGNMFGKNI